MLPSYRRLEGRQAMHKLLLRCTRMIIVHFISMYPIICMNLRLVAARVQGEIRKVGINQLLLDPAVNREMLANLLRKCEVYMKRICNYLYTDL